MIEKMFCASSNKLDACPHQYCYSSLLPFFINIIIGVVQFISQLQNFCDEKKTVLNFITFTNRILTQILLDLLKRFLNVVPVEWT